MLLQRFRRIQEIVLIPLQNNFDNFLLSYAFSLNKGYLSFSLNSICLLKFILYRCLVPLLSYSVGYDSLCLFSDDVCVIKHKNWDSSYYSVTKQPSNHCNKTKYKCSDHIWTFSLAPDSFRSWSLLYPAFCGAPLNSFPEPWYLTKSPNPGASPMYFSEEMQQ